jgi:purine-binding chemotaxis protein CheW
MHPVAQPNDRSSAPADPATTGQTPADPAEPQTYLTLRLGGQHFALSVAPVREILDEQPVAALPGAPPDVAGLIDVRGESVMVMEVAHRLGVIPEADRNRRIVVIERGPPGGRAVGVFADQVMSVVEIAGTEIEAPPQARGGSAGPILVQGVARLGGHLVLLLDHRTLLGDTLLGDTDADLFDFGP